MLVTLCFFHDPATTEIYTLSLHDALPISSVERAVDAAVAKAGRIDVAINNAGYLDRKSTRLNSSHVSISYAVFCLKKKTNTHESRTVLPCHIGKHPSPRSASPAGLPLLAT